MMLFVTMLLDSKSVDSQYSTWKKVCTEQTRQMADTYTLNTKFVIRLRFLGCFALVCICNVLSCLGLVGKSKMPVL